MYGISAWTVKKGWAVLSFEGSGPLTDREKCVPFLVRNGPVTIAAVPRDDLRPEDNEAVMERDAMLVSVCGDELQKTGAADGFLLRLYRNGIRVLGVSVSNIAVSVLIPSSDEALFRRIMADII